ncbi:MAG: transporter [Sulfurimonas sp.]|nr:MAG: transporter [Sulfurimonas sp.]
MNTIEAKVKEIQSVENLNIVKFDFHKTTLIMMSLELNKDVKIESKIKLSTKSTHIGIAKSFNGDISYSNQLKAKIINIDSGKLLSSVTVKVYDSLLESIMTKESCQKMNLQVGETITVFIEANELSILEILND